MARRAPRARRSWTAPPANSQTTLAADSKGRIWAVWSDGTFGETHVLAARSNPRGDRVRRAGRRGRGPGRALDLFRRRVARPTSALDILALFGTGNESGGATYHARVQPGLTLKARKSGGRVTFTVTDAGDPVRGARVKAGRSGRTDSKGRVTLPLRKGTATATATGYEPAKLRVR